MANEATVEGGKPGRPVVINEERITIAEQIVDSPGVVIARTDEDMVDEVNYRLKLQDKSKYMISLRSYERYKAKALSNSLEELTDITAGDAIVIERFWRMIKAKLRLEKLGLLAKLSIDPKRQRWAWVYERKFTKERALNSPRFNQGLDEGSNAEDNAVTEVEVTIKQQETA